MSDGRDDQLIRPAQSVGQGASTNSPGVIRNLTEGAPGRRRNAPRSASSDSRGVGADPPLDQFASLGDRTNLTCHLVHVDANMVHGWPHPPCASERVCSRSGILTGLSDVGMFTSTSPLGCSANRTIERLLGYRTPIPGDVSALQMMNRSVLNLRLQRPALRTAAANPARSTSQEKDGMTAGARMVTSLHRA